MSIYGVAALVCYALVTGYCVDRLLAGARWVSRHPSLALFAWHAAALAFVGSLTGAMLLVAHDVLEHALVWLLHADKFQLHLAYAGGRSIDGFWNGAIVLPIALIMSVLGVSIVNGTLAERRRREFRVLPRTVARLGRSRVVVIEHDVPAAHCLPGRGGRSLIVLTTAALANLTPTEVEAALEHEQAHLRRGHHRMVLLADSLAIIFAWTGALRSYPGQVRRLVELDADDVAVRRFGHRTVASALLAMCTPPSDPGLAIVDLSFSGSGTAVRIRRLLEDEIDERLRLRIIVQAVLTWAISVALLLPPAVVLWPAALLVGSAH